MELGNTTANGRAHQDLVDKAIRQVKPKQTRLLDLEENGRPRQFTEWRNAERLAERMQGHVRWCPQVKAWFLWNGKHWERDETEGAKIAQTLKQVTFELAQDALNAKGDPARAGRAVAGAQRCESKARVAATIELLKHEPGIAIRVAELDSHPFLLNCQNGTLNLETGKLQAPNPEDLITQCLAVDYDPTAPCPTFLKFMERIFRQCPEKIEYVQRFYGYCLTGDVSEHKMMLSYGIGRNGKSTLNNVMALLLGSYAGSTAPETFQQDRHGNSNGHSDLSRLVSARLVIVNELEDGRHLRESLFKAITGGDPITTRDLYCPAFTFYPQFKVVMICNHKPPIKDDNAIWSRIDLMEFNEVIGEAETNRGLPIELQMEMPGILAWLVQGCMKWRGRGLQTPDSVRNATQEYRQDQDLIGQFVEECLNVSNPNAETPVAEVYGVYTRWCEGQGIYSGSNTRFTQRMLGKGFHARKSGIKKFIGVAISPRNDARGEHF